MSNQITPEAIERVTLFLDALDRCERLREVIGVFFDAGITDIDVIIACCCRLRFKVGILARTAIGEGVLPFADRLRLALPFYLDDQRLNLANTSKEP